MTEWKRLSVRDGRADDDGPYDGVPGHLRPQLSQWVLDAVGYDQRHQTTDAALVMKLASVARVRIDLSYGSVMALNLLQECHRDEGVFLDVVDGVLHQSPGHRVEVLRATLATGNSIWTVNKKGDGLERLIDPTAVVAKDTATTPDDLASTELKEAWAKAYSRTPDASDAWDHAIKAMEALLTSVVVPNQDKATLGHVVGHLKSQGSRWRLALPGPNATHGVEALVAMLDLAWPNSDRHANQNSRVPSLEEARALVHVAVTVVQWMRDGVLQKGAVTNTPP